MFYGNFNLEEVWFWNIVYIGTTEMRNFSEDGKTVKGEVSVMLYWNDRSRKFVVKSVVT